MFNSLKIKQIIAREILDSRGNPTVEAKVLLRNGVSGAASVPSGASTGSHEALELRDNDLKRYGGKGVLKAVKNVNTVLNDLLIGKKVTAQKKIDQMMIEKDGTENKSKLGANAILGVSMACAHAAANALDLPLYKYLRQSYGINLKDYKLPLPMMNVINGGKHADNTISTQEFMIVPKAKLFKERVRSGAEIFHALKKILQNYRVNALVGDEGGYAPNIEGPFGYAPDFDEDEIGLELIVKAIGAAGYKPGDQVSIAIDVAASELYKKGKGYDFNFKQKNQGQFFKSYKEVAEMYQAWVDKYPIISIEDPLAEDEWNQWKDFTGKMGKKIMIVGDDLFVTNINRLKKGIEKNIANSILIKLNQIGTLTETIQAISLAQKNKYKVVISHRSGETNDTTIADLAVAVNADFIKTGSLSRSERVGKYNRLMEIEEELAEQRG
jgi:enolase